MQPRKRKFQLVLLCLLLSLTVFGSANAVTRPDFYAVFNPAAGAIPFPNNLLFTGSTDGTLNIPASDPNNLADPRVALNALDGFSTVAPLTAQFSSTLKTRTIRAGNTVRLFEVTLVNPFLNPSTKTPFAITGIKRELQAGVDYAVTLLPQDPGQSTLVINPLRPLQPKSGYLVVLTNGIQDSGGFNAAPSPAYKLTKLSTPLVDTNGKSLIPGVSDTQAQALEPLRQLVNNQESVAASQGIAKHRIILSWTFMTQSTDDAFIALDKDIKPLGMIIKATSLTTTAAGLGLPGFSDIYAGVLVIPYYLDKDQPLSGYWHTAAGASVTRYNPLPAATTTLKIPVLMTVPNITSGNVKPKTGWPVVIFQHGITRSRADLLLLADALSFAGFAAVAIDLPLHGITDKSNVLYTPGLERTFDLDLANNTTGQPGPDGIVDESGTYFVNLKSFLTTRDNLREAAEDLRQLTLSLPLVDLDGDQKPDLDVGHIRFVGHSQGAITGSIFLAIESNITSATLGMAGGGLVKLFEGSPTFGPPIIAGLAAAGLIKGTPEYEAYLNLAQTIIDSGDPINYGAKAANLHPIHLIEVVGSADSLPDQLVPNTIAGAPLSGTEPLAEVMGLQSVSRSVWDDKGLRAIVRFTQGDHRSLIDPRYAVDVTAEMQGQMISFLQSEGTELEIIYKPVVQQ
ncbi:MAG: Ig-like domain-containing protein [Candidatus Competibacteraceae bacterium]